MLQKAARGTDSYRNVRPDDVAHRPRYLGDRRLMWGGTDEAQSIATIHAAVDRGVTLIDTAPAYGFGRSEEIVGKALAEGGLRDRVRIATKVGLAWKDGAGIVKLFGCRARCVGEACPPWAYAAVWMQVSSRQTRKALVRARRY
jgi:aryl-alcohol dehydrogenase-like predicted oxidoreductase